MSNIDEIQIEAENPSNEIAAPVAPVKRMRKANKIQDTRGDKVLEGITTAILVFLLIIVAYPVIYVCSASISSAGALTSGRVVLWPVEPTLSAYKVVLSMDDVLLGYKNTLFYTVVGTIFQMFMQIICAYPISKRNFQGRSVYTKVIVVTMLVSAGMIPMYLVKQSLGLIDNVWAVLVSGLIGSSNVFILRTNFRNSIPGELFDAAAIDGANEFQCLVKIALPLSKATLSVITLYAIVGHWNSYMTAMIYLPARQDLWPLQLFLRNLLISSSNIGASAQEGGGNANASNVAEATEQLRYALIVISTVPILAVYGVVQKYFKTGVMVGSVKG
ncbi:MAG: carbohydrate ABC transporter permease [Oscillospiraceae bacterium]|nr:carbohydrate ABC transporter permease [Oscillospiraceae bacterium]